MKRPSAKAMQAMKAMKANAPMKALAKKAMKAVKAPMKAKKPAAVKAKAMKAQRTHDDNKPGAIAAKARPPDPMAKQLVGLRPHFLHGDDEMQYEVNQVIDGELVCQQSVGCHSQSLCHMLRQMQDNGLTRPRIAVFFDSGPTLESSGGDRTPYDDSQQDDDKRSDDLTPYDTDHDDNESG